MSTDIDYEHLNKYVNNDDELTREVFGLFKTQVDIWSSSLYAEADDDIWSGLTHALKGSARAIGALDLAQTCQKAEELVGEGKRSGARDVAVQNIDGKVSDVLAEIQRWEYRYEMRKLRSS